MVLNMIRFEYDSVKELFQFLLDFVPDVHLFLSLSVHDVLWGYEDPILKKVQQFLLKYVHKKLPFDDHVGLFYKVSVIN